MNTVNVGNGKRGHQWFPDGRWEGRKCKGASAAMGNGVRRGGSIFCCGKKKRVVMIQPLGEW